MPPFDADPPSEPRRSIARPTNPTRMAPVPSRTEPCSPARPRHPDPQRSPPRSGEQADPAFI